MIIANPIYDVVFKHLMDDTEIAMGLISALIGEEVIQLDAKPQETSVKLDALAFRVYRLDYKAVIKTDTGAHKTVTIELQKAKELLDIFRFRRYIGKQYSTEENITLDNGTQTTTSLPILPIYILGFPLENIKVPVVRCRRNYIDVATGEVLSGIKEEFIELLSHDTLVVQLHLLKGALRTPLERLLQVFNQMYVVSDDKHRLHIINPDPNNLLLEKILRRLSAAAANHEVEQEMELEDEIERTVHRKLAEKDALIDIARQSEERALQQKEEAQRQKEEAQRSLSLAVKSLSASGMSVSAIAAMLQKPEDEIAAML